MRMSEANGVDDASLGRVHVERSTSADVDCLPPEFERRRIERVEACRGRECRSRRATGDGDVDCDGDRVDESMAAECRLEAHGCRWCSFGDFDEVEVADVGTCSSVQAMGDCHYFSFVSKLVERALRQSCTSRVTEGEQIAKLPLPRCVHGTTHVGHHTQKLIMCV